MIATAKDIAVSGTNVIGDLVEAEEDNYSEICFFTEGKVKKMRQDTDKKKEAMTRMEMRISKEDKALIEQKAGITTSEFIRRSALGRRLPNYGDTTILQEYSMQLGKIGSNLNQIAKYVNQGFPTDSLRGEIRETCRELVDLKFRILPAREDLACGKKYKKKPGNTATGKESG